MPFKGLIILVEGRWTTNVEMRVVARFNQCLCARRLCRLQDLSIINLCLVVVPFLCFFVCERERQEGADAVFMFLIKKSKRHLKNL